MAVGGGRVGHDSGVAGRRTPCENRLSRTRRGKRDGQTAASWETMAMDSSGILSGRVLLVGPPDYDNSVGEVLDEHSWECIQAHSMGEALWRLRNETGIDVVVIRPGPRLGMYTELCRHLKLGHSRSFVSVLVVLEPDSGHLRAEVFEAGADDCIQMPAPRNEILLRLLNAVRIKRATDSLEDATAVITALANAIEGKDAYTCGHVERVAMYSVQIGRQVGVEGDAMTALKTGAMVHDIGKVVVPDQVLNKPGRLTDEEMDIIRRHPAAGYDILRPLRTFKDVLPVVRWHHERPNGTGYPDRLKGDDLPLLPRIVAVADCFDALSTDRPYRPALALSECWDILSRSARVGDLDPDLTDRLFEIVGHERELAVV